MASLRARSVPPVTSRSPATPRRPAAARGTGPAPARRGQAPPTSTITPPDRSRRRRRQLPSALMPTWTAVSPAPTTSATAGWLAGRLPATTSTRPSPRPAATLRPRQRGGRSMGRAHRNGAPVALDTQRVGRRPGPVPHQLGRHRASREISATWAYPRGLPREHPDPLSLAPLLSPWRGR